MSLAYFAHVTQNRAVQVESLRHYGQSLARQRSALTQLPNFFDRLSSSDKNAGVDVEATTNALLATVILSYFELISPSNTMQQTLSSSAWINHTLAAERLIAMLGPQSLSNDIIGQLFFSIRSHAVNRTAILGHYTIFSEKEWLEAAARQVPKQSYARSAYDRVTEWILRLTRLSQMKGRISSCPLMLERAPGEEVDTAWSLLEELRRRYAVFLKICRKVPVEEMPLFITRSNTSSDEQSAPLSPVVQRWVSSDKPSIQGALPQRDILTQERPSPVDCMTIGVLAEGPADLHDLHPNLQKLFAAMTTAYFHAAAILLQTLFPEVTQEASSLLRVEELFESQRTVSSDVEPSQDDSGVPEAHFDTGDDVSGSSHKGWDTLYNARVILAAGRYLAPEGRSNGTAVLRMMLPFSVIWRFCRDPNDASAELRERQSRGQIDTASEVYLVRLEARQLFADWCKREGMSGLVSVGFADMC